MRHPQVIIWEQDGRLAHQLGPLAADRRWVVREARRPDVCRRMLLTPGPTVFVLRLAPGLEDGPVLLEWAGRLLPGVRTVAVGEAEGPPALPGLAWDLGADFALFPPVPLTLLPEVVAGLMGVP